MDTAYFVKYPRTIEDLRRPHIPDAERHYEIVANVSLAPMDYENFITDMAANGQFIEVSAELCGEGKTMRCLFVRLRGSREGILVVPESASFVKWAAYTTTCID